MLDSDVTRLYNCETKYINCVVMKAFVEMKKFILHNGQINSMTDLSL